jgi:hypothetical protein
MNVFLKGPSGDATPASQNLGSDYCCSGAGSKSRAKNDSRHCGSVIAQGTF